MGHRESRAREALARGRYIRVSVNPPVYIYLGVSGDYVLIDRIYCSCKSFSSSLSSGAPGCKHLWGLEYAEREGRVSDCTLDPRELSQAVMETSIAGLASTLRSKLESCIGSE